MFFDKLFHRDAHESEETAQGVGGGGGGTWGGPAQQAAMFAQRVRGGGNELANTFMESVISVGRADPVGQFASQVPYLNHANETLQGGMASMLEDARTAYDGMPLILEAARNDPGKLALIAAQKFDESNLEPMTNVLKGTPDVLPLPIADAIGAVGIGMDAGVGAIKRDPERLCGAAGEGLTWGAGALMGGVAGRLAKGDALVEPVIGWMGGELGEDLGADLAPAVVGSIEACDDTSLPP